jgi:hypothetical protein
MKRWICVLMGLPYFAFSQNWMNHDVVPLNTLAYQKNSSPVIGLYDLPAFLGFGQHKEIGLSLENKYGLKELAQLKMIIAHPLSNGNISLHGSLQGSPVYTRYSGSLGYGLSLNKQTTVGIALGITHFQLRSQSPETIIQIIAGIAHAINEKTTIGIHYHHHQSIASKYKNTFTKREGLTIGIGYRLSKPVFLQLDIRKQEQHLRLLPALNWTPNDKIGFWCGTNGGGHFYLGLSGKIKKVNPSIGLSSHPHLGYSIMLQINRQADAKD